MTRIGVYGGTFDPVHLGHLQLAHQAIDALILDELLFVPSASPPHKNHSITDISHRKAMLELVCKGDVRLSCSDIECRLPKPSYTVATLTALKEYYSSGTELIFIMGVDAFLEVMTWKSYTSFLSMVEIAVSKRVGCSEQALFDFLVQLGYTKEDHLWRGAAGNQNITVLPEVPKGVCSSEVRKGIGNGMVSGHLLSHDVVHYIEENSLYNP